MIHIAFLTSEYPHSRVSRAAGIGTSIKNLAIAMVERGVKVTLFIYGQKEDAVFRENKIDFHLISQRRYPLAGWYRYRKFLQNYLNEHIKKAGIDVVEAPDWTGITAFMKLNVPLVLRIHGTDAYFCHLEGRKQKHKNYFFESQALKKADALIAVSDFAGNTTREIFKLEKKITTIYNGVVLEKFPPAQTTVIPNSILYFGTLVRKKGVLDLASAFVLLKQMIPEAKLTYIGKDNPDILEGKSTLEIIRNKIPAEYHDSLIYKPHMSYENVIKEIEKSAVIALPSHAEAFPMTWLEAMAMQKALVTSDIGWAEEMMVQNETGIMVDPKDYYTMALALKELITKPELREIYGKAARDRIENYFTARALLKKNIAFYKDLLK